MRNCRGIGLPAELKRDSKIAKQTHTLMSSPVERKLSAVEYSFERLSIIGLECYVDENLSIPEIKPPKCQQLP